MKRLQVTNNPVSETQKVVSVPNWLTSSATAPLTLSVWSCRISACSAGVAQQKRTERANSRARRHTLERKIELFIFMT